MLSQSKLGSLILLAAFFAGVFFLHDGKPAPAFSLPKTYGGRADLASYSGRPVLLVFWTTSCPICRRELPMLDRMEPEFSSKGISVVTILLGEQDDGRAYLSSNRIDLTSLYDSEGLTGRAYSVGGVPKFVLIDKDGKIKRSHSGWASEDELRAWMNSV